MMKEELQELDYRFKNFTKEDLDYQNCTDSEFKKLKEELQRNAFAVKKTSDANDERITRCEAFASSCHSKLRTDFEMMEKRMEQMASKDELGVMQERIGDFALRIDFDRLKEVVVPSVAKNEELVSKFTIDNEDMMNCIKQFDIDLCTKANKSVIHTLEASLESVFIKRTEIDNTLSQIKE